MRAFFRQVRGILVFAGFTLNTFICIVPIIIFAIIKLLLPIPFVRRVATQILMWVGEIWISVNSAILDNFASIDWQANGLDNLRRDEWYLILCNHLSWIDILVLQKTFNRRIPFPKFFLKQELIWFPVLGIAWWAMDMPFMKRYSPKFLARNPHMKGKDLETTRRACEKFRHTPTSVINFVEGTRLTEAKRVTRKSPYRHLLQPRAGGLAVAIASMGKLFGGILDVTLTFPDGYVKYWDMCCGTHVRMQIDVRERPIESWLLEGDYQNDREFRRRVHAWLGDIWQDKDDLIEQVMNPQKPND